MRSLSRAVLVFTLGLAGCGSTAAQTGTQDVVPTLPTSVLDGTEERALRDLPQTPLELSTIAGSYDAEQGGAMLIVHVRVEGDVIHIERTFREPTMDDSVHAYALRIDAAQALSETDDAALRRTTDGVLLWERTSGVEGIPSNWWSHYRRVSP